MAILFVINTDLSNLTTVAAIQLMSYQAVKFPLLVYKVEHSFVWFCYLVDRCNMSAMITEWFHVQMIYELSQFIISFEYA